VISAATLTHVAAILQIEAAGATPVRSVELLGYAKELLAEASAQGAPQSCPCGKCMLGLHP
jgi:hypothetical protein